MTFLNKIAISRTLNQVIVVSGCNENIKAKMVICRADNYCIQVDMVIVFRVIVVMQTR